MRTSYLKKFLGACLGFISLSLPLAAQAETEVLTTSIVGALEPERASDSWIFLLSAGGRALRVEASDRANVEILRGAVGQPRFVEIEFEDLGEVDRVRSVAQLPHVQSADAMDAFPIEPLALMHDPSVTRIDFKFSDHALTPQGIFDYWKSFGLRRGSQCFHRAYYWAHQLWRQTGALTHKVFMFFTGRYIRRYNYNWWFHVAPYVYDQNGEEVVLDPTFLKTPVSMKKWTDNFLRNDPECPVVPKYMGHHAQARDQWCYVVKAPMWYYHPNIIEKTNKGGEQILDWDKGWLANARRSR